jgi:hypothetical protein
MKKVSRLVLIFSCIALVACSKKAQEPSASAALATPPGIADAPNAPAQANAKPVEKTAAQEELELKKGLMDYATMEDQFMNDARAQWASTAKASSTFGDEEGRTPSDSNAAKNILGAVDGKEWTNNHQDIGFDWAELGYEKAVSATEVRVAMPSGDGVEALSKIELQDPNGKWNTVWSGISDQKRDQRGRRTWFVRSFEKTAYKVKAVKVTFANNLQRGYKVVDAVQLVGD